jgi:hypothetical protein
MRDIRYVRVTFTDAPCLDHCDPLGVIGQTIVGNLYRSGSYV